MAKKTTPYIEEDKAGSLECLWRIKAGRGTARPGGFSQHLVVRLSWVFGPDKPSFIDQIIQRARENEMVTAVADKFSRLPTPSMWRIGCGWPSKITRTAFCIWPTVADAAGRNGRNMRSMFAVAVGTSAEG